METEAAAQKLRAARKAALELALGVCAESVWERISRDELIQSTGGRWHRQGCCRSQRVRARAGVRCELDLWLRSARAAACCISEYLSVGLEEHVRAPSAQAALLSLMSSHGMPAGEPGASVEKQLKELGSGWISILVGLHRLDPRGEGGARTNAIEKAGYDLVRAWIAQLRSRVGGHVMHDLLSEQLRRGFTSGASGERIPERISNKVIAEIITPSGERDHQWLMWTWASPMDTIASVQLSTETLGSSGGWHVIAGPSQLNEAVAAAGGRALARNFERLSQQERSLFFELVGSGAEPDQAWSVARSAVEQRR